VRALERGDASGAAELMREHIGAVAAALGSPAPRADPLDPLRIALRAPPASLDEARVRATPAVVQPASRPTRRLFTDLMSPAPTATRAPPRRQKEN
jgi:hypothetical protein